MVHMFLDFVGFCKSTLALNTITLALNTITLALNTITVINDYVATGTQHHYTGTPHHYAGTSHHYAFTGTIGYKFGPQSLTAQISPPVLMFQHSHFGTSCERPLFASFWFCATVCVLLNIPWNIMQ